MRAEDLASSVVASTLRDTSVSIGELSHLEEKITEAIRVAQVAERHRCAACVRACNTVPFVVAQWIDDPRELDYALNEIAEDLISPTPV